MATIEGGPAIATGADVKAPTTRGAAAVENNSPGSSGRGEPPGR